MRKEVDGGDANPEGHGGGGDEPAAFRHGAMAAGQVESAEASCPPKAEMFN